MLIHVQFAVQLQILLWLLTSHFHAKDYCYVDIDVCTEPHSITSFPSPSPPPPKKKKIFAKNVPNSNPDLHHATTSPEKVAC